MRSLSIAAARRPGRGGARASTLQFAVVVAPFVILVFACLQTALIFLLSQALQTATTDAAPFLTAGRTGAVTAQDVKTDVCDRLPIVFDCDKLRVDVHAAGAGAPGDLIVIRTTYDWPVVAGQFGLGLSNQPDGGFRMIGAAVLKPGAYS